MRWITGSHLPAVGQCRCLEACLMYVCTVWCELMRVCQAEWSLSNPCTHSSPNLSPFILFSPHQESAAQLIRAKEQREKDKEGDSEERVSYLLRYPYAPVERDLADTIYPSCLPESHTRSMQAPSEVYCTWRRQLTLNLFLLFLH